MTVFGYARVSSIDQDYETQEEALKAAGCNVIRAEKVSGTSRKGRSELQTIFDFIREGDVLVVTRIDRLARNTKDLIDIMGELKAKKVGFRACQQGIDIQSWNGKEFSVGRLFMELLGVFASFETNIRRERQLEGIQKAKAAGVYAGKGRKPSIDREKVMELRKAGHNPTQIAREMGIDRTSVYRLLAEEEKAA